MPKRGKREDSYHYLAVRVTQNMTSVLNPTNYAMVPVPDRYDDGRDMTTAYKVFVDKLNAIGPGPDKYEVIAIVSVRKASTSSAFLKFLSTIPHAQQASSDMESKLEAFFTTDH